MRCAVYSAGSGCLTLGFTTLIGERYHDRTESGPDSAQKREVNVHHLSRTFVIMLRQAETSVGSFKAQTPTLSCPFSWPWLFFDLFTLCNF